MEFKNMTMTVFLAAATFSASCSAAPLKGERKMQEHSGRIYAYESDESGFNTKNFFYDNGEEVVAFDTQFTPELAEKSIAFLRTRTSNPITHVVITHPNPDKFNGMSAFQKLGAKVIASRRTQESMKAVNEYKKYFFVNMAKMFTEETYPKLSPVDSVFDQTRDLRLKNGESIVLSELEHSGVSSNQTIASIASMKAVIVGDLVHFRAHAWLEGGILNGKPTPTLTGWMAGLRELQVRFKDVPETLVYGGRGQAVALNEAVKAQISYLEKADDLASDYVAKLGVRKSELLSEQAASHHKVLQSLFEKAFPDYDLGYMIQYGISGLVNSKL